MYLTQTNFLGKTGPINPQRTISAVTPAFERQYPNRWMEDRNLRTLHLAKQNKSNSLVNEQPLNMLNINNKRYMQIVEKLVQKEHCWKLLKWVHGLSEENKKGLRIISTVLDIRGAKRFKDQGRGEPKLESVHSFDVNAPVFDAASAQAQFRKTMTQTSYRSQFGEPPKAAEDFLVVKQRKFRSLEISQYLQPLAASFLEKWISLGGQDTFIKPVFFSIREIHTTVKNQERSLTTNYETLKGLPAPQPPRFDKMILGATVPKYAKYNSQVRAPFGSNSMSTFENHADLLRTTKVNKVYENLIDTKQFKQDMLRGQPFKILDFVELKNPKKTFYQDTMHGKHPVVKAKIIDLEHTSCGHGGAIPDPQLMTKTRQRTTTFSNDLMRMTRTQFDYRE